MLSYLFAMSSLMLTAFGIPHPSGQIGGSHDPHGCLTTGGYSWCRSHNACERFWEPCPDNSLFQAPNRDSMPPDNARPPVPSLPEPELLEASDAEAGVLETSDGSEPIEATSSDMDSPIHKVDMNHRTVPQHCHTWYDGCNTCEYTEDGVGRCTLMLCLHQGEPTCLGYTPQIN